MAVGDVETGPEPVGIDGEAFGEHADDFERVVGEDLRRLGLDQERQDHLAADARADGVLDLLDHVQVAERVVRRLEVEAVRELQALLRQRRRHDVDYQFAVQVVLLDEYQ